MDKMPKKTMKIANTQANTGRLMKNKAMVYTVDYLTGMKMKKPPTHGSGLPHCKFKNILLIMNLVKLY